MAKEKAVECPSCGEDMEDTGKRELSEITKRQMRIMHCPCCGNEAGVSESVATNAPVAGAPADRPKRG